MLLKGLDGRLPRNGIPQLRVTERDDTDLHGAILIAGEEGFVVHAVHCRNFAGMHHFVITSPQFLS